MEARMPVLDHLIVSVNDREASLRFYTEVLGFEDGDSFDRADNMKGPGIADGAHGETQSLYLFDPNHHLIELLYYA